MRKKLIAILTLCFVLCTALCGLIACSNDDGGNSDNGGQNPPAHTHVYNKMVVNNDYLKSYATTTQKAMYYYSCECGEKGTETFEYGEFEKPPTEGLVFTLINNDTEYSVTDYTGTSAEVYIPATYKGKPVTFIGPFAFEHCDSLTSIEIPDSATSIGEGAFRYCSSLTSIIIPDGVTFIGPFAFEDCDLLTSIIIPDSVTFVDEYVFSRCDSLETIYCEATVKPSGWDAWKNGCDAQVIWGYKG